MPLLLYEHPLSSYAQKVKIALREKGVAFELEVPESFGTGRTDGPFADAPRAEVPVLVDGPTRIFESTVIMEFIEERWPDPPLLPRDPAARAAVRITEDVCDTQYGAVNRGFGEVLWFPRAAGALGEALRAQAARHTAVLQDWLGARLGNADWFGGASFGWADAAAVPMVNRSVHYGLGPPPGTALAGWHRRVRERPSVAATFAELDAGAARMAASDLYTTGGRRREYRDHRLEWMVKSGGIEVVLAGLRDGNIRFPWPDALYPGLCRLGCLAATAAGASPQPSCRGCSQCRPACDPPASVRQGAMLQTLHHLRHRPSLLVGLAVAILAAAASSLSLRATTAVLIGWDLGVVAYALAFLVVIRQATPDSLRRISALLDGGRWGVLAVTVIAALASLGAIVAELAQVHGKPHAGWTEGLAGATVVLLWFFIHMIFTTHYAHEFWRSGSGLSFPGNDRPTYSEFLYFSFCIAVASQVSDVSTQSASMRQLVLAHSMVAYLFNTAAIALGVNIAASLAG